MGMEHAVTFPAGSPPSWPAARYLLASHGFPVQVRMINGELAFPDEEPPENWRERGRDRCPSRGPHEEQVTRVRGDFDCGASEASPCGSRPTHARRLRNRRRADRQRLVNDEGLIN